MAFGFRFKELPPVAGLEIGTTQTVVLVGESMDGKGGDIRIIGKGVKRSMGVCKGMIGEVGQARLAVQEAVKAAEDEGDVNIGQVMLAVSGGDIESEVATGHALVESGVVSREDMEEAREMAGAASVKDDRQILHSIPQFYKLDGQVGIAQPEGMHGKQLAANILVVHGKRNHLDDAIAVVRGSHLDVRDTVFAGICAAKAVLSPEQKRNGVLLVHLGGGVTNYVCFVNGAPALAASLPVGGDHVTNDIKFAFNLNTAQADQIKRERGCAVLDPQVLQQRLTLSQGQGFGERTITLRSLHTVMNARLAELFHVIRHIVDEHGFLPHLASGVVLTGGGAYVSCLTELVARIFGAPCVIGQIRGISGLEDVPAPASFAAAAGLILHGFETAPGDASFWGKLKNAVGGEG